MLELITYEAGGLPRKMLTDSRDAALLQAYSVPSGGAMHPPPSMGGSTSGPYHNIFKSPPVKVPQRHRVGDFVSFHIATKKAIGKVRGFSWNTIRLTWEYEIEYVNDIGASRIAFMDEKSLTSYNPTVSQHRQQSRQQSQQQQINQMFNTFTKYVRGDKFRGVSGEVYVFVDYVNSSKTSGNFLTASQNFVELSFFNLTKI
jgi:hypothetical protein